MNTKHFQAAEPWKFYILGIFTLPLSLLRVFSSLGQASATWCLSHCNDLPDGLCPQSCDLFKAPSVFLPNFFFPSDVSLILLLSPVTFRINSFSSCNSSHARGAHMYSMLAVVLNTAWIISGAHSRLMRYTYSCYPSLLTGAQRLRGSATSTWSHSCS